MLIDVLRRESVHVPAEGYLETWVTSIGTIACQPPAWPFKPDSVRLSPNTLRQVMVRKVVPYAAS